MGDGEGDEEVRDVEEFGLLFGGPALLVERSALGTRSVVAGVVSGVAFLTTGALVKATTEFGCPAREDAPDSPIMGTVEL